LARFLASTLSGARTLLRTELFRTED
jgi:hypothetical protein